MTSGAVLSIIIVNWNTRDHLALCLASLRTCAPPFAVEVIVVDNCSSDGTAAYIIREWPSVVLIRNIDNKGFAGGVNDGLRAARGKYILVMNPDIQVHPRCLEYLVEFLDGHPETGAVMPELFGPDGTRQCDYVRLLPRMGQVLLFHTILEPLAKKVPFLVNTLLEAEVPHGATCVDVEQIPGAMLLTRRTVVDLVGPMDEGFKLFYEDVDWCFRMKQQGWRLVLDRDASATHAGGGSFHGDSLTWQTGRFVLSLMRFFDCHSSPIESLLVKWILLTNSAAVVLARSIGLALFGIGAGGERRFSRTRHLHVLRLFYLIYVAKRDPGLSSAHVSESAQ